MAVLYEEQIKRSYFSNIGGFPPAKIMKEVKEYKGESQICVACTQLDYQYIKRDQKRILAEWVDFLRTNTNALKALHFNSHVPQILFDAACYQTNLEELRFKWGSYSDLAALENLANLKFLYIGSGSRVQDIESLGKLRNLVVLYIENFKHIEDYSTLSKLDRLEQLVISGPILGNTPIKDLEFLLEMKNLLSIWIPNTTIRKKYTSEELDNFQTALPNLYYVYNCIMNRKKVK